MHGLGNDYLYVYGEVLDNIEELSVRLSERHFGAGSDGMIYISPYNHRQGKAKKTENSSQKVDRIIKIAKSIVQEGADIDGWMHFSAFMNELWRKENDFNPQ